MESTFAFLKACSRRYSTMTDVNVASISRARQNHLSTWLRFNKDAFEGGSVKQAYIAQIQRNEDAFTLEEAEQCFAADFVQ